jgi:uncharacterized repeat protein (TIGR01451 family)/LPXTG-motif cell wall-anchored protein
MTADATTTAQCSNLSMTKTADAASVDAGQQIGFTITATNNGNGRANNVVIDDPLPAGPGIDWSIASGPETCSITGSAGSQAVHCSEVSLGSGDSESVHVVSATTGTSCQAYPNTASLTASNAQGLTASASTTVANCIIVSPPSPPKLHHPAVLPNTGGPDRWIPAAGLALLVAGAALVAGDRRRRHRS